MRCNFCEMYKAQGIEENERPAANIVIGKELPKLEREENWEKESKKLYQEEAKKLYEILVKNLPGGTLHALLVKLLEEKASLLRVPLRGV